VSRRKKSMKFSNWGDDAPPQEERATQDDEPRRPRPRSSYRDRKNWCRGKIDGQRHSGVVELEPKRWQPVGWPRCYRPEWGNQSWRCSHREVCSNIMCRKTLRWSLGDDCPDYTEAVTLTRKLANQLMNKGLRN
jgi:hypothetical protein